MGGSGIGANRGIALGSWRLNSEGFTIAHPRTWISTDSGATWSIDTEPIPGFVPGSSTATAVNEIMTGVKLATNVALIAVKGTWALNNFRSFFISTDNGASFTQCGSFAGQFATTTAWTSGFLQAPDGSIIAPVARTFATATWNLELWRGVFNGSNDVAWESVSALVSLSPIECDAFALNNNSFALDAPPVTEEEEPTPALTGRNDMLVLSSTTGKWTSYSLS